jgi:hypothetical protein
MPLEKRARIAQRFLQASYKADHVYEDCLNDVLKGYRDFTLQ